MADITDDGPAFEPPDSVPGERRPITPEPEDDLPPGATPPGDAAASGPEPPGPHAPGSEPGYQSPAGPPPYSPPPYSPPPYSPPPGTWPTDGPPMPPPPPDAAPPYGQAYGGQQYGRPGQPYALPPGPAPAGWQGQPGYPPPPYGQPYGGPAWNYGPAAPYYPNGITASDDTTWALLGYLGQFAIGIIAPLIVYFARKDRSPFVRFHGAQALNLALTQIIVTVCCVVFAIVTIGFGLIIAIPALIAVDIASLVYLIIAAVRAGRNEMYRIPTWLCWRMVR